jgi:hypothetical protein
MGNCLYSTNPWIKWLIYKEWRGDTHSVWCSPVFDLRKLGADERGSLIPPTSSPAAIYRDLANAARIGDRHNSKIVQVRASLTALAAAWLAKGEITNSESKDIQYLLVSGEHKLWRPLLYVIPTLGISGDRIQSVPPQKRAGLGEEFQIHDLLGSEFDRIEFDA